MKVAFYLNYLNHHQVAVTDAFYDLLGEDFSCICTQKPSPYELKGGDDYSTRAYCINATTCAEHYEQALILARTADVCLFGAGSLEYAIERAKHNKRGLSFEIGERWLKKGLVNIFSPRLLRYLWYYHTLLKKKNLYKLCASAYAAEDQYKLLTFKDRCYKWGYFTVVDDLDIEILNKTMSSATDIVHIMWCARFLRWKHPEIPIKLAARLREKGYKFVIDMFGSGEELERMKVMAKKLGVTDVINFCGNKPNREILEEMRKHDMFLFTSDRNEGWGAVLNEAMANGCTAVGSDAIGAVPFLINDGVNGLIFESVNVDSLEGKVEYLINNPSERQKLACNGYNTIKNVWSPQNAARNLLILIDDLLNGRDTTIVEGPCSKALPI